MPPEGGRAAMGERMDRVARAGRYRWTSRGVVCVCVEAGMAGVQAGMSRAGSAYPGEAGTVVTPSACDGVAAEKISAAVPLHILAGRQGQVMCVCREWQGGSMGMGMCGPQSGHGNKWQGRGCRRRAQAGLQTGPEGS